MIMKKLAIIAVAILQTMLLSAQFKTQSYREQFEENETRASFRNHISMLAAESLEGRAAGSEGEKSAAGYVSRQLEAYGLDVLSDKDGDTFGIMTEGDTLTSRNVIAFIPGYDKTLDGHYIVIGARLDNLAPRTMTVNSEKVTQVFCGANGNASGLAMLLELGRMLSANSLNLRRSVLLVAFGASMQTCAGSWYFLNRSFPDVKGIDAMINLDMLGTVSRGFYAYSSSNPDMNAIAEALNGTLQPIKPQVIAYEPYSSDHRAFYDKGIPSILFTTGRYPEYGTVKDTQDIIEYDGLERELEYIYNYSVSLANGPKPIFNVEEELKKRAAESSDKVIPYYDCDWKPTFLGSNDPKLFLEKWVYHYLRYPQEAVKNGIQGKVLVGFIIDEKGKVTNVHVLKGVDPLLDDEAVRVISASPAWKPGIVSGKKVKSEMTLYVEFRLEKKK